MSLTIAWTLARAFREAQKRVVRSRLRKKPWPLRLRHLSPMVRETQLMLPRRQMCP
jgi:hypothetical protein